MFRRGALERDVTGSLEVDVKLSQVVDRGRIEHLTRQAPQGVYRGNIDRRSPIGYPGGAEVVNMQPPAALLVRGVHSLSCIGDGRQSGTSGSPSILNAAPEAAAGGGSSILQTGDRIRIDLGRGSAEMLVPEDELEAGRERLEEAGGFSVPDSQPPWQEIQRSMVAQFDEGMVPKPAVKYQDTARTLGPPRNNH